MSIQQFIEQTLQQGLKPDWLSVTNESYLHRSSSPDAESHFKVVVVSTVFDGERLIARHRRVNALLAQALQNGVHALALHTYTPTEWLARGEQLPESTQCAGH
ncbi:BolA family protein [Tolumonas lignilytica]|jgi:Stress-induced morphogen (activity unknown)|uniref:BolA family protein n=1 Tax=Tolumonas lignilytica TaxID=1283284 RepID=UPI000463F57E|nr:BolA family protein [Tolumonas lignilytica]